AINPPPGNHAAEFDAWDWKPVHELPGLVVPFKRKVYEQVVEAFAHLARQDLLCLADRPARHAVASLARRLGRMGVVLGMHDDSRAVLVEQDILVPIERKPVGEERLCRGSIRRRRRFPAWSAAAAASRPWCGPRRWTRRRDPREPPESGGRGRRG